MRRSRQICAAWTCLLSRSCRDCSSAQVEALAQCTSLTDLECGQWLPTRSIALLQALEVQPTDAQLRQIDDGLATLIGTVLRHYSAYISGTRR